MNAPAPHLPIMATENLSYDVRRYREDVQFWKLATLRLTDPVCRRELARLESLTDDQKANEYPLK